MNCPATRGMTRNGLGAINVGMREHEREDQGIGRGYHFSSDRAADVGPDFAYAERADGLGYSCQTSRHNCPDF